MVAQPPLLQELRIRDLGVINEVALELAPGLNVLTGETGAGKTMVVSALELLLGARAAADRVRAGAEAAVLEALLRPAPPQAAPWLGPEDEELVVAREIAAGDGARSRARLGGRLAPVSALAEALGDTVELHGQAETARLSAPAVQRELLDRFGGAELAAAKQRYAEAFGAWQEATAARDALHRQLSARDVELERLRGELAELEAADPQPGEGQSLATELARLEHAETLGQAAGTALAALTDEGGARDALGAAVAALRPVDGLDPSLDALAAQADALAAELQELALALRGYADELSTDPERLETLRERRALLAELTRRFAEPGAARGPVDADALRETAAERRERLEELGASEARIDALERAAERCAEELETAAVALREQRRGAGERLTAAVEDHLGELGMAEAALAVAVTPDRYTAHGADQVRITLAANPGEGELPLARAASGGERSRIALAVRLAIADVDETSVLVFDEIDAGVGGATALAVGEKLARLAEGRQVLCVTHLAQLAAYADAHFVVTKQQRDGRTSAAVQRLGGDERLPEISRMLSGTPDSSAAADHAAELLDTARAAKGAPRGRPQRCA